LNLMVKRALMWFASIIAALLVGELIDYYFGMRWFWEARVIGLLLLVPSFFLLRESGRALKTLGNQREWGITTKLVTSGIYSCIRHPHHLGIGLFVTGLSLLIGGPFTFIITTIVIWVEIIAFLKRVEEPELIQKFGDEYIRYKEKVPILFPKLSCLTRSSKDRDEG
jgi:protein-S-isoprenylcysteine O-methyltransferase Ste14